MTFCHTYPRSSPEKAVSKSRRQCSCCPYGYHIDLDFVRYCESITNSQLLPEPSHRRTRWNNMRRQRASREILLGLADTPKFYCEKYSSRASDDVGDDLQKAVLDFERTLYHTSSLRRNNKKSRDFMDKEENLMTRSYSHDNSSELSPPILNGTGFKMKPICEVTVNGSSNGYLEKKIDSFDRLKELEEQIKVIPLLKERILRLQNENRKLTDQIEEQTNRPPSPDKIDSIDATTTTNDLSHSRNVGVGCSVLTREIGLTAYTSPSKTVGTSTIPQSTVTSEKENVSLNAILGSPERLKQKSVHTSTDLLISDVYTRHDLDEHERSRVKKKPATKTVGVCTDSKTDTRNASVSTTLRLDHIYTKTDVDELINKSVKTAEKTLMNSSLHKKLMMNASTQIILDRKNIGIQFKVTTSDSGIVAKPRTADKSEQIHVQTTDANVYCDMTPNRCEKCTLNESVFKAQEVEQLSKGTLGLTLAQDASVKNKLVNSAVETDDSLWRKVATTPTHQHYSQPLIAAKRPSHLPIALNRVKPPSPKVRKPQRRHSSESDSRSEDETFAAKKGPNVETKMDTFVQSPKQIHSNKREPSKEMKGALKVLNDALRTSPFEDIPKHVKTAVNIIQQEWFKVSSVANANPLDVEDYLDCFEEMSSTLLEYIVNMADVSGNTAMHYAVSHGNFDVVSILLDSKVCNINKMNTAGYTCIMLVALTEVKSETDREVVRRLFHLADVNIRAQEHGQTALMLAVSHGRIDTVELLLEAGADINIQDEDGSTALMCAAEHGYVEIVKLLLAQPDCDLSLTDSDGSTALEIAMDAGNRDIGVLLYAQVHFSRGSSPFASMKHKRSKSATPTFKSSRPTTPSHSSHKTDFETFDH